MVFKPKNPILKYFIPTYDELTLFLMSSTFLILVILNSSFRKDLFKALFADFDTRSIFIILLCASGLILSLYHIFTQRRKTSIEKELMLFFAVLVNAYSGIYAGYHILEQAKGWLIIFPIWNIGNGLLLLFMLRFDIINENNISDDNASPYQAGIGLFIICIIFIICQYFLNYYWSITFSICVAYATSFNKFIQNILVSKYLIQKSLTNH